MNRQLEPARARVIPLQSGYRLRDLVIGLMIAQLGLALAYALWIDQPGPSMTLPVIAFASGLLTIILAFGSGAATDAIISRFPELSQSRRCSAVFFLGGPLAALTWALSQDHVMSWIFRLFQGGTSLSTVIDRMRDTLGM